MALAHTIGDKVEAAYRRGDMFDKRRQLMADWASFVATIRPTTKRARTAVRAASNISSMSDASVET
jgi:hypothetical protein